MTRKIGREIHTKAADECFTDEQKAVLEYTQGKRKITIEKTLNRKYGHRQIIFLDDEEYLDAVADIIFNNS